MRYANLLLDLDGTLTDPKIGISRCIQHALHALGHEPPDTDTLDWCIGPPLQYSFGQLLNSTDVDLLAQAVHLYRQRFAEIGLFENRVYDGIPEVLATLQQQGCRLFLATSKPRIFAKQILDHFNLAGYFETAHGSELNGQLTDKPSLVRHILAIEGLQPDQTMIVGDRKFDIIGGKANGIRTGAVTYGYGTREELEAEAPDLLFDSPDQLLRQWNSTLLT
ncbi:HAD hydrolase-like protein [uncultured Desulfobulbus sp.]|uniref:HAD hydrolase-like protein n=1 Tax=uncultured Desulfobulbus sp. TaxID=239745 RepID=UPI0029C6353E|nr:HAD hydrolase-like protein [uncultured Desulfobulbus sp.]